MAYKKNELIKKSLEAIKKHNLYFIEDVVAYLLCGKTTFFKYKLNDVNEIKEASAVHRGGLFRLATHAESPILHVLDRVTVE